MEERAKRLKVWGWFFFDWASQPYNTLLLTFVFAPYLMELIGDGTEAQAVWGFGVAGAGIAMALLAPVLGALADSSGTRMRWIWLFSIMYVVGSSGLWLAKPDNLDLMTMLAFFAVGLVGMEFATIFTNSMLPDLGTKDEISRISGNGWAFGYVGGLFALVIVIAFFAENAATGKTIAGLDPPFGLDATAREGTRFAGPFVALWYAVFMVPFFTFVRDPRPMRTPKGAIRSALREVGRTIVSLPHRPSLFAFLGASMFYRDALNGMFTFGGIFAAGVLGWSVTETGTFGILAIIASAFSAWIGGFADKAFGSKRVILVCIVILIAVAVSFVFVRPDSVFSIPVEDGSPLPDVVFYVLGFTIGAAGGALLPSSRTLMVSQGERKKMTEGFGLYALSGKATSFITPLSIGVVTAATGSQQLGVLPLALLLVLGFILLQFVHPDGDIVEGDSTTEKAITCNE